ncbi:MAG: mannose-1-phosphate guanylyltransferase/mannose-6-phosphate isomerase [Nitrospinae bacterium]|nr:mannose-1-phosphate guanylyltransferase/mannose-6-phosphate isomerase [Nitrospinota bacterium]
MYAVILAGGSGTRFWPKSRELFPKQLITIAGAKTMLQNTVERILPLVPIENIFVVTNELHAVETCKQLAEYGFNPDRLIAEPAGRNTAPAIGLAAKILSRKTPEAVMGVFPADHVVEDGDSFLNALREAESVALRGYLVTIGIKPTRPETGYGYIKKGPPLDNGGGSFQVERFVEKPDLPSAQRFLEHNGYFWNSGVFLWKVSTILEEIKLRLPELDACLKTLASTVAESQGKYSYRVLGAKGKEIYNSIASISVDYGIMEKSQRVALVPASVRWSDVGSWSALEEVSAKDASGNVFSSNVVSLDCSGSIVQGNDRLIAAVGIKNIVVVDTPDALLVCEKNRSQDVRRLVEKMNEERRPETKVHATVLKPWGSYTVLEKRENYLLKRIEVLPGEKLSLQSHRRRSEHWLVVSGAAEVELDGRKIPLARHQSLDIPQGSKHRLCNPGDAPLTIIETQIGETLEEDDIVRYEDLYGRS